CASSAASNSWSAAVCGLLSLPVMPDRPSPRPPVLPDPQPRARRLVTYRPTESVAESVGGPGISHKILLFRHYLEPLRPCELDPVKTTKGRRMSAKITVGGKAPGFTLPRDGGGQVSLTDFKGKKLVLYFYPKADTPGCTLEAKDFSRLAPAFTRAKTAVLGVS